MTTVVDRKEAMCKRGFVRSGIWISFWLLLLVGSPWRSEAGEAGAVADDDIAQRVAAAKTAADHEAIATYYRAEALAAGADAKRHEAMLAEYRSLSSETTRIMLGHCQTLISSYQKAKDALDGLAKEHENLAKSVGAK